MTSPSYPAALDALANPGPTTETDDAGFELDVVVARLQNCIMALEHKLGIGAGDPPSTAAVLRRTATGASAWGQVVSGDIAPNTIVAGNLAAGSFPQLITSIGPLASPQLVAQFPPAVMSQAYKHLQIKIYGRSDVNAISDTVTLRFNAIITGLYHGQFLQGNSSSASSAERAPGSTSALIGSVPGAKSPEVAAGAFGVIDVSIPAYSSAVGFKHLTSVSHHDANNTATYPVVTVWGMTCWGTTAAITQLDIALAAGQWNTGSIFSVYGWN